MWRPAGYLTEWTEAQTDTQSHYQREEHQRDHRASVLGCAETLAKTLEMVYLDKNTYGTYLNKHIA